jgi:hypothetical protein
VLPKLPWPFLFGIKDYCNLIRFKMKYLSLLNTGATLFTPLEIMDCSVSSPARARLEFLTGFTSGAVLGIIFMIA